MFTECQKHRLTERPWQEKHHHTALLPWGLACPPAPLVAQCVSMCVYLCVLLQPPHTLHNHHPPPPPPVAASISFHYDKRDGTSWHHHNDSPWIKEWDVPSSSLWQLVSVCVCFCVCVRERKGGKRERLGTQSYVFEWTGVWIMSLTAARIN